MARIRMLSAALWLMSIFIYLKIRSSYNFNKNIIIQREKKAKSFRTFKLKSLNCLMYGTKAKRVNH
jgi:hypothetical protein